MERRPGTHRFPQTIQRYVSLERLHTVTPTAERAGCTGCAGSAGGPKSGERSLARAARTSPIGRSFVGLPSMFSPHGTGGEAPYALSKRLCAWSQRGARRQPQRLVLQKGGEQLFQHARFALRNNCQTIQIRQLCRSAPIGGLQEGATVNLWLAKPPLPAHTPVFFPASNLSWKSCMSPQAWSGCKDGTLRGAGPKLLAWIRPAFFSAFLALTSRRQTSNQLTTGLPSSLPAVCKHGLGPQPT